MEIRKAIASDVLESLCIAKELKEWFTKDALEKMKKDFEKNFIVAFEKEVIGFLNYKINKKSVKILWVGVMRSDRRRGVGRKLLYEVERIAKENNVRKIIVNTLSHKDNYVPYVSTRNFYLKNGFDYVRILPGKKGEDEQVMMEKKL